MRYLVEHLPWIGKIQVVFETTSSLSIDSITTRSVVVREGDNAITIRLPVKIASDKPPVFTRDTNGTYILRLIPAVIDRYRDKSTNILMSLPEGKWDRKALTELGNGFKLRCGNCHKQVIFDSTNCCRFHAMPSEFWTELMDYWHCHKPAVSGVDAITDYKHGYNGLKPAFKEVLVGGSFFLAGLNTIGSNIKLPLMEKAPSVYCVHCDEQIGDITKENLCKIYKWKLELVSTTVLDTYRAENDVILSLLGCMQNNSSRFILVKSGQLQVFIWVVGIGLNVSNKEGSMYNAFKIYYKDDVDTATQNGNQNIDEINVLQEPFALFISHLNKLNEQLPSMLQTLGKWKCSYICLEK